MNNVLVLLMECQPQLIGADCSRPLKRYRSGIHGGVSCLGIRWQECWHYRNVLASHADLAARLTVPCLLLPVPCLLMHESLILLLKCLSSLFAWLTIRTTFCPPFVASMHRQQCYMQRCVYCFQHDKPLCKISMHCTCSIGTTCLPCENVPSSTIWAVKLIFGSFI